VRRVIAGIFDPSGRARGERVAAAVAPYAARMLHSGPLRIAYTGTAPPAGEPLCLLEGFIDDARELAHALGLPHETPPEGLLAAGYRRWGPTLLPRLRGDFVLLVWDREHGEGLIARDQLGVRCMYLHEAAGVLCFASEIHHLLALLPSRPPPDPVSVAHLVAVSNRSGPDTLYAGVRRLNPGSLLSLDRRGARERPYWQARFAEPLDLPVAELGEHVLGALHRAVARRIDSDGETGVLMSGGLDSASVASVAAAQAPGRISAYAGVFPEHPAVDESELIDALRRALALPGMTAEVRAGGLLASVVEHVRAWQMPPVGWGDFWTVPLLASAADVGVGVMLGGDGGDELFCAREYVLADRLRGGHPRQALALAFELPGAGDRPPRRQVARVFADRAVLGALPYRLHNIARRALSASRPPGWMRPEAARDLIGHDDPVAWKRLDGPRWWAHIAHGITRGVEEGGVFEHLRRRAALAGVQARHPLFDLDLLELALRQLPEATLDRHRSRPVLRAAMTGLLPDSVRMRPEKAWFDSLIVDSLSGPDGAAVQRLITGPEAELRAYVDCEAVQRALFRRSPTERPDRFRWMHQVWRLLSAECWLRAQHNHFGEAPSGVQSTPARVEVRSAGPAHAAHSYVFPP